jgi:TolB-like protein
VLRQEALVAGRASALARYEQFCQLLDTELGVGPEVETRRLAESFRSDPVEVVVSAAKPLASMASILSLGDRPQATPPSFAPPARSPRRRFRWYGLVGTAAGIAALVLLYAPPLPVFRAGSHDVGEEGGRISMSVLPFQVSAKNPELERLATTLHGDVVRAIARDSRLSVVHAPAETVANMPRKIGEALHVRYLLAIDVGNPSQGIQGGIQLWDTATGVSFRSVLSDIRADDEEQLRRDFTREVLARLETALQRARQLEAVDKAAAAADAAVIPVCAGAFSSRFDAGRFFTETTRRTAAG